MLLKGAAKKSAAYLNELAWSHPCASHPLFERLRSNVPLTPRQAIAMLANYDAHASVLRRLLLRASAFMPEPAVGFILENVRNEYGNGNYLCCHQGQLRDVIDRLKKLEHAENGNVKTRISSGVRNYIREVVRFYHPALIVKYYNSAELSNRGFYKPAITAGAVTATELMAIEEFKAMQVAFRRFDLDNHRWFDHVNVECEHGEESLDLAEYFILNHDAQESVDFGFQETLAANVHLYDGLLEAISATENQEN